MLPLYAERIEDLGPGDFVKVDCAACHHVALLAPDFLLRLGLSPQTKVLDLKERVPDAGDRGRERGRRFRSSCAGRAGEPAPAKGPAVAPLRRRPVHTEATRSGSRPTGGEHRGILDPRSPGGAATDDRQIAGRRFGGTGRRQSGRPARATGPAARS